jgi:hypothetical protein
MIELAFAMLSAAGLIGIGLAIAYLRGPEAKPPHPAIPLVHGALGGTSLLALVAALGAGLPKTGMGTSGFGAISAGLLGLAFVLGLTLAILRRYRRPPGALVGAHASLAIAGFVILLALIALSPSSPATH